MVKNATGALFAVGGMIASEGAEILIQIESALPAIAVGVALGVAIQPIQGLVHRSVKRLFGATDPKED